VRVLELFAGIGGCAAALAGQADVVAAIDIHGQALDVYSQNFPHPTCRRTIESIPDAEFARWFADLWWLSPPCQPYTRRGLQRDTLDPRATPLLALIDRIPRLKPQHVALENVPPFAQSMACQRLRETLESCHYRVREYALCPTQLGVPNRRARFYLVASQSPLHSTPLHSTPLHSTPLHSTPLLPYPASPLQSFLDPDPDPALVLPPEIARQYAGAIDVVDATDPLACCSCFTSAYGRSPVRSGSYLATSNGLRRFSPGEILRLLGFPAAFRLDPSLTREQAWRLVGNSLSVTAVAYVLSAIPGLSRSSP